MNMKDKLALAILSIAGVGLLCGVTFVLSLAAGWWAVPIMAGDMILAWAICHLMPAYPGIHRYQEPDGIPPWANPKPD